MEQLQMFTAQRYKITTPIRLIELFAGVGSQAMALRDIGADFEHYRVVEFDKYAVKSYNAIHGTDFTVTDIRDIHGADLGIVDKDKYTYLMTYSFPCTDLSVAGKMQGMTEGSGTRSSLLWEVKRLLAECEELPQLLLMENVPQVHGKKNIEEFKRWNEFLKTLGYTTVWKDMNAKDYGVAQSRNRCFALSMLGNYSYEFPNGYELTKTVRDYLEGEVDEKYYINSERVKKMIEKLIENGKLLLQPKMLPNCMNLVKADVLEPKFVEVKQATKEGKIQCMVGGVADLNYPTSKTRRGRVIDNGMIAPTLTTDAIPNVIEDDMWEFDGEWYRIRIRKLTPLECWRLMDFTDEDFRKAESVNSNTQLYKQAGNSIVKNCMCEIFRGLF